MKNFSITSEQIVPSELIIQLEEPDCGAIATFSGIKKDLKKILIFAIFAKSRCAAAPRGPKRGRK